MIPQVLIVHVDAPGAAYLSYTPNGKKLITAGVDNFCRIFSTGSDDEPVTVDDCQENSTAVVASVRKTHHLVVKRNANRKFRMASLLRAPRMGQ